MFSREQLLNHLYDDYRVVTDRTIDSHIIRTPAAQAGGAGRRAVVYPRGVWRWLPLGSGRLPAGVVSLFPARAALRRATRSPPSASVAWGKAFYAATRGTP